MSTSWVAGVVRAQALAMRRLGAGGARAVASRSGMAEALAALAATPYGHDVQPGQSLAEAQHAVGASLLWNMRVLAGWLPRGGADVVRRLAAGFEVANVDEHLMSMRGGPADPPYSLGTLDTAWSRVAATTSPGGVADVLAASPWRFGGVATGAEVHIGMRLAWADSVVAGVPEAADWARAAAALLLLREVTLKGQPLSRPLAHRASYVLGRDFVADAMPRQQSVSALRGSLPTQAIWALDGVESLEDLWRAEAGWWHRVERDGFTLLRAPAFGRGPVVGALAVLAVDAWRVRAALVTAARGGAGPALEAFDGVA